jgi:hypothetical protein
MIFQRCAPGGGGPRRDPLASLRGGGVAEQGMSVIVLRRPELEVLCTYNREIHMYSIKLFEGEVG